MNYFLAVARKILSNVKNISASNKTLSQDVKNNSLRYLYILINQFISTVYLFMKKNNNIEELYKERMFCWDV